VGKGTLTRVGTGVWRGYPTGVCGGFARGVCVLAHTNSYMPMWEGVVDTLGGTL
jgi:hypothetical protein